MRIFSFVISSVIALAIDATAATITVTSTADSGSGSLRAALKGSRNGDTINFAVSGAILLTSGELLVSKSVKILGPGAGNLAVNGNHVSRVFRISSRTTVSITGLTIANGVAGSGGGIFSDHATVTVSNCFVTGNSATTGIGGGILSDGHTFQGPTIGATLTVSTCEVSGNSAYNSGGGIANNGDSGSGTATIINSKVTANSAGYGGGVWSIPGYSKITFINSTISSNSASNQGGGIYNAAAASTMVISNCTVSGNTTPYGSGGGIYFFGPGTATVLNSTVFGNPADFYGSGIRNGGVTLQLGSTIVYHPGQAGDIAGSVTSLGYNLIGVDPLLGPLQDNGGPTLTHAPLPGSPVVDHGYNFSGSTTDQRGFARTYGAATDIGAVEAQPVTLSATPSSVVVVEGSNDGTTWTPVTTINLSEGAAYVPADDELSDPMQFYRVRLK